MTSRSQSTIFENDGHAKLLTSEHLGYPSGWRAILLLQFQPQFQLVIYASILVSYVMVMVDFAHAVVLNGMRTNFHIQGGKIAL